MDIKLTPAIVTMGFIMLALSGQVNAKQASDAYTESMTGSYSQKTLLKNWAFSVCLAQVSNDSGTKADANATASAYLEFGRQRIEAYDALRKIVDQYASRKYGGSVHSEFNAMKCIDLFHSKQLENLTRELTKSK